MDIPDNSPRFDTLSNQLEQVEPDYSELSDLFGELSERDLITLHELSARESELTAWIAADPRRASLLQSDPTTALQDLVRHLRIEDRELNARLIDLPQGWNLDFMRLRTVPAGTKLTKAVWAHLNTAPANLTDFKADPLAVVAKVAASTGATAADSQAVVEALSTVLGIVTLPPGFAVEWLRNRELAKNPNFKTAGVVLHRKER